MRAPGLILCLALFVALLILSPRPASAQPSAAGIGGVSTGIHEEIGYRYRGRYGYGPGYRRYGYYRPYYRPYYGYYGYRRPYYGYGYGYPYYGYGYGYRPYWRPGISLWFGF
jgi:hypothetical protein